MKTRFLATAVAALIPLAGLAAEGKTKPTPKTDAGQAASTTFDSLDANKDGRISMPEASADPKLVESFSTADKNGDGYLDSSEYESAARQPKQ